MVDAQVEEPQKNVDQKKVQYPYRSTRLSCSLSPVRYVLYAVCCVLHAVLLEV